MLIQEPSSEGRTPSGSMSLTSFDPGSVSSTFFAVKLLTLLNQQADKQGGDGRQQKFGQADYPGMPGHFRLFAAGTEAVAAEIRIELAMVKQIRLLPRAGSRADE